LCCRKWWIEIWAKERRQFRLSNPWQSQPRQGVTCASTSAQRAPNEPGCGVPESAIHGSRHLS
jgi:hypothetical protein